MRDFLVVRETHDGWLRFRHNNGTFGREVRRKEERNADLALNFDGHEVVEVNALKWILERCGELGRIALPTLAMKTLAPGGVVGERCI
jgi:hypothetical protein